MFFTYFLEGRINLAFKTSSEAIRIAEESGDIYSKALAYTAHGISCWGGGFFERAIELLLRGVDFCERINLFMWNVMSQFHLAQVYFETGEYQKSRDHYEKAVCLINKAVPSWMTLMKIGVEMAKVLNSEKDIHFESLYSYVHENKVKMFEGYKLRYIGELLLNIDDQHLSEAEDWIKKAIKTHKRDGMMWHLGRNYALYAELFKRKGDQSKAKENLNKAIDILKECGADGWVERYEKELTSLS